MDEFDAVVQRLNSVGLIADVWVDGSFVTEKIDPEDVDLALRVSSNDLDDGTQEQFDAVTWFSSNLKMTYACDSYVWVDYPKGHPQYWHGEWMKAYWVKQFGFSRGNEKKGIAVVELRPGVA